ncbi:ATP-dependent RecD-like DNA helicase [Streptomyces sp. 5-6(2022)]|uniref:SF1B family DNA helicase RecD2 n=1 Tax=Streptomyces sp. 5-6(2022) TaxID=2936510 RepID=UPI0023BA10E4|nr:ATP-dependent RecD-like DNA helicase [Streptomyces sp. 5-6(2022)]
MFQNQPTLGEESIDGIVSHLLYIGYDQRTVLRLALAASGTDTDVDEVTALGSALFGCKPGESLRLTGVWADHPRHGRQFKVRLCERTMPAGVRAIRLYLASGMIRGIGPILASSIVDRFGEETLNVIDTAPDQLLQVFGIGAKRLAGILEAWREQRAIAELMVFLQGLGIFPTLAVKIYQHYSKVDQNPLTAVRNSPYTLCRDVRGIGFVTADRIALAGGIPKHSQERLQAALLATLDQSVTRGDCHLSTEDLMNRTRRLLKDDDRATVRFLHGDVLGGALADLRRSGYVVMESIPLRVEEGVDVFRSVDIVSNPRMHRAESALAHHVMGMLSTDTRTTAAPWQQCLDATPEAGDLTSEQRQGVLNAFTRPLSVLTGGPGCGKTHTLRTVVELADSAGLKIALGAPTGKAAKRLEQLTGQPAQTVHRLLHAPEGNTLFDHSSMLEAAQLVVVDEASMLDVQLAAQLFGKIPHGCHLLLVGDTDQLPSVGPGLVLRDLLAVPAIPRTRLTKIFRQADASSAIVDNAHRVLHGHRPIAGPPTFSMYPRLDRDALADDVVRFVTSRPKDVSAEEIQVLCPSKKHAAGLTDLNIRLQAALNPPMANKAEQHHDGRVLRTGDRVVQTRTNRHLGVLNGSTGVITAIETDAARLTVDFEGLTIVYPFTDLDDLLHSYAMTVHRSQGSEYPYVIIVLPESVPALLTRNLLYTAITRARSRVFLLYQDRAVSWAVNNISSNRRNTALEHRIARGDMAVPSSRHKPPEQLV